MAMVAANAGTPRGGGRSTPRKNPLAHNQNAGHNIERRNSFSSSTEELGRASEPRATGNMGEGGTELGSKWSSSIDGAPGGAKPPPISSGGTQRPTFNVSQPPGKLTKTKTRTLTEKDLRKAAHRNRWLIDPRKSTFIGYWDMITGVALIYTALVTPWEVAFAEPPTTALEAMFVFNRFIDCIFIVDMALQFQLIYQAPTLP